MRKTTFYWPHEYLAHESGTLRKTWVNASVRIALVYPNTYYVGMSNLGFHSVYEQLNQFDHVVCERFFLPDDNTRPDMLRSIESQRKLREFDIIAFSISFENDYIHILQILSLAKIPLMSHERSDTDPLLVAGGVATFLNPEPIADFMDVFLIGEAESILPAFIQQTDFQEEKKTILTQLARTVKGAYVPSFYDVMYDAKGAVSHYRPIVSGISDTIERQIASAEEMNCATTAILTPNTLFGNTFLMEVGKGCPHGCRFCSAGFVYRPPRFHSRDTLQDAFSEGMQKASHIGLVGAAVSDHPDISSLLDQKPAELQISFSSLRADNLTPLFIQNLLHSRIKTVAIAPDAGSQRLRNVINKGLTEEHLLDATQKLVAAGIPNIKIYFMIGLPTETDDDIRDIVELTKKIKTVFLKESRLKGKMGQLILSISSFVPKPWTPFQWCAMNTQQTLKQKLSYIRNELKRVPNVKVHSDPIPNSILQGILARGNRTTSALLRALHESHSLAAVLKSFSNETKWLYDGLPEDTLFPWDIVTGGVAKPFLWEEYQKALRAKLSSLCPMNPTCKQCGACALL